MGAFANSFKNIREFMGIKMNSVSDFFKATFTTGFSCPNKADSFQA